MTLPLIALTGGCCGFFPKATPLHPTTCDKIKRGVVLGSAVLDILGTITLTVLAILAVTKVLSMPPAAAYSMFGVAGLAAVLWATLIVKESCCN